MEKKQWNTLLSLKAVDTFLDIHAARLATVVATGARAKLKSTLAELVTLKSEQEGGKLVARSSTIGKASLRTALMRDHMAPIARIAEAELAQAPEFSSLRMPRGRATIPRLVSAAEGMGKAAAPYSAIFTGNGLPADFVVQLNSSAESLLASEASYKDIQRRRRAASNSIKAKLSGGRGIVNVLDAFVHIALKDDPTLLASWNRHQRVHKTRTATARIVAAA